MTLLQQNSRLIALREKIARYSVLEEKERCESSLFDFLQGAWPYIDAAPFQSCFAVEAMCEHLEAVVYGDIKRLLINVPPRCAKTLLCSVVFPAWVWARSDISYLSGPQVKFLCASYSHQLSLDSSTKSRRLFSSPWYQKLWPNQVTFQYDENTKGKFANIKGGERVATSVGGGLLGLGGDILCLPYNERILTNEGWLKIGDVVTKQLAVSVAGLSEDNIITWQKIEKYETNPGGSVVEIKWANGSLRCTDTHPVYVEGRGFVSAGTIKEGDVLREAPSNHLFELWGGGFKFQMGNQEEVLQEGLYVRVPSKEREGVQREKYPTLFNLWRPTFQTSFGKKTSEVWGFLQQKMPWKILCGGTQCFVQRWANFRQNLSTMWQRICSQRIQTLRQGKVLHKQMCECLDVEAQNCYTKRKDSQERSLHFLFGLRKSFLALSRWPENLFKGLCRRFAFTANERFWKYAVCAWPFKLAVPARFQQAAEGFNQGARWQPMRDLQNCLQVREIVRSSSYRLQQRQYRSNEFNDLVQRVSPQDQCKKPPAANLGRVVVQSVKRVGYEQTTYNLCVTPCHTYFAEGILVHNCADDLNNTERGKIESDAERITAANFWSEFHSTRLNNAKESAIINVQQRVHEKDVSGIILDSDEDWVHLMIPMRHDIDRHCVTVILPQYDDDQPWEDPRTEQDELMWPERFGEKEITEIEIALGPYLAAGRLQQAPTPKGGGIIKREWWQPWDKVEAQKYGLQWDGERKEFPTFELVVGSLDTSYGEKQENDYNALTIWGIWIDRAKNRRVMLMYAWQKRLPLHGKVVSAIPGETKVSFEQRKKENFGLIEWVADTCKRYKVKRLLIENKTRGQDVANEINRLYARDNWGVELLTPVRDKVSRVHSVVPLFTDDAVWAPDTKWSDLVLSQCSSFPKAEHDDLVDSMSQVMNWLRETGLLIRADEMSAALEDRMQYQQPKDTIAQQYGV